MMYSNLDGKCSEYKIPILMGIFLSICFVMAFRSFPTKFLFSSLSFCILGRISFCFLCFNIWILLVQICFLSNEFWLNDLTQFSVVWLRYSSLPGRVFNILKTLPFQQKLFSEWLKTMENLPECCFPSRSISKINHWWECCMVDIKNNAQCTKNGENESGVENC